MLRRTMVSVSRTIGTEDANAELLQALLDAGHALARNKCMDGERRVDAAQREHRAHEQRQLRRIGLAHGPPKVEAKVGGIGVEHK